MNRKKQFIWNGLLLTAVSLLMRGVGVSFNLFVTNRIGSEAMGLFSLIGSVYGFALTLATSGIHLGTTRMVSEALGRNDRAEVRSGLRVCFGYAAFFGTISGLLLFFLSDWIGICLLSDERSVLSLRLLSFSLLPTALSSVLNGYFTAVRRVHKNAAVGILEQSFKIAFTVCLLLYIMPPGAENACIALVLGGMVSEILSALLLGLLFLFEKRQYPNRMLPSEERVLGKRLRGIALPVAFSAYARSGLLSLEHLLIPITLTAYFGDRAAALSSFGILHGVVLPVVLFPSALLGSYAGLLVPEIAECRVQENKTRMKKIIVTVFRATLLFSVGVSGIMLCFSYEIGGMLSGGDEAVSYLKALAPLIPVMYLDGVVDAMLKGHGEQVYTMQVNILDSFLSVVLVWILLPRMGIDGYLLTIYITELLNASLSITRLLLVTDLKPSLLRCLFCPLLSVIGATAVVRFLAGTPLFPDFSDTVTLSLHIGTSVLLYLVLLVISRSIRDDDLKMVRGVFRLRRTPKKQQ